MSEQPGPTPTATQPADAAQWPALLDFFAALSSFFLLAVPLLVGTLAFLAHATPLAIFARMACAVVVVGTLLALINWNVINAVLHSAAETRQPEPGPTETVNHGS